MRSSAFLYMPPSSKCIHKAYHSCAVITEIATKSRYLWSKVGAIVSFLQVWFASARSSLEFWYCNWWESIALVYWHRFRDKTKWYELKGETHRGYWDDAWRISRSCSITNGTLIYLSPDTTINMPECKRFNTCLNSLYVALPQPSHISLLMNLCYALLTTKIVASRCLSAYLRSRLRKVTSPS